MASKQAKLRVLPPSPVLSVDTSKQAKLRDVEVHTKREVISSKQAKLREDGRIPDDLGLILQLQNKQN